jgi:hypothetical protein
MAAAATTVQRKSIRLAIESVCAISRIGRRRLLSAAGDEGRQPLDVAGLLRPRLRRDRLRPPAIGLRLARTEGLLARLVGLGLARRIGLLALLGRVWLMRLATTVSALAGAVHRLPDRVVVHVVVSIVAALAVGAEIGLGLAELLLGGCDQPKVVLGMLKIVFGSHRIA